MTNAPRLHIALYQPEIAGNTGAILRLGACLAVPVHIIEPTGFDISDKNLKRAGMDYLELAALHRHLDWQAFEQWRNIQRARLLLLTTKSTARYTGFAFEAGDIVMFGRESSGVPEAVHQVANARLTIPMAPGARSLNLSQSAAMVAGEAIRQIDMLTDS
jgi:tRNA (cytidine/uridine-2'-O-)-methyltransferase